MSHNSFPRKVNNLLATDQLEIQGSDYYNNNWNHVFSIMYISEVNQLKFSNLSKNSKAPLFNSERLNDIVYMLNLLDWNS